MKSPDEMADAFSKATAAEIEGTLQRIGGIVIKGIPPNTGFSFDAGAVRMELINLVKVALTGVLGELQSTLKDIDSKKTGG